MSPQLIGIIAHCGKPGAASMVPMLKEQFRTRGLAVHLEKAAAVLAGETNGLSTAEIGETCDLVVVLGGDGTLLQVVHDLGTHLKPIFGINIGSLGFLTCVSSSAAAEAAECIANGKFILSERTLLIAELVRDGAVVETRFGLNDAVVSRGQISRLIKLEVHIDGGRLTEYSADGLIVATPTGSTAYSLAAGGPVMTPNARVFVITPICPHVLTNRSVIVDDTSTIEIRPVKGSEVFITVDGQDLLAVQPGDVVRLRRAESVVQLAMMPEMSFFEILRHKLKWSGSAV